MKSVQLCLFTEAEHRGLVPELTKILHDAYGALAAQGMRYWASYQTPEDTLYRLLQGESYLAFVDGQLAGTINLRGPDAASSSSFYRQAGVYSFRQFAVAPAFQGGGVGARLLKMAEERARELGAAFIALDTSDKAESLLALYERRGYSFREYVQWDRVNYRSVILAKAL